MSLLKNFLGDRRGNFAMMTVIASIPMLGGVALSVEYANISRAQSNLQNAVDAAVLSAARFHEKNQKLPKKNDAKKMLLANFDGKVIDFDIRMKGDELFLTATADTPPFFFGKVAPHLFKQTADATVPMGNTPEMEIALVLDTTGSMAADGKMTALRQVARDFIDSIAAFPDAASKIRLSLVPFADHVNVGTHNAGQSWLSNAGDVTTTTYSCQWELVGSTGQTCSSGTRTVDGVTSTVQSCTPIGGTMQEVCKDRTYTETWWGCVGSRTQPYTIKDTAPNVRFEAVVGVWCPAALRTLTNDFADLKGYFDYMIPQGETYIAEGVMWGLRTLSPDVPFTESKKGSKVQKVMIVMSDGDNTKSTNLPDPRNWGTDVALADSNTLDACKESRTAGITVYSIAFGTTISTSGKKVLQECANSSANFYDAKDASALAKAFEDILRKIGSMRLSS